MSDQYRTESFPYRGGAFFTIEETVTASPHTFESFVRHVVRHPGGAAVVAVDGSGQAVCIEQYRPAIEQMVLEIPAGRPEPGESFEDAARRELLEETGLFAPHLARLPGFHNAPCFCDGMTHLFLAQDCRLSEKPELPGQIPTKPRKISLDSVEELVWNGTLVDAKTILGLLIARSFLAGNPAGALSG